MGYELAIITALIIYFSGISIQDIKRREISNSAPIILIMASPFITDIPLVESILGLIAVFVPLFIANITTNGFGMGDVKLCAAFGFVLGALAEYAAIALALSAAIFVGKITNKKSLPLAPFICSANLAVIFFTEVFLLC